MQHNQVLIIVGPTAVGKTDIAIRLAEEVGGEIISSDSRLLYQGMDIGTAKPSKYEMAQVKHHMIDLAMPDEIWSLAQYQKETLKIINEVIGRDKLPIIVDGTGQYYRALVEGWVIPPQKPNEEMRSVLEKWAEEIGPEKFYHSIQMLDPESAAKIDMNNTRRVVRALEVIFCTGQLFSSQKEKIPLDFNFKTIGLSRPRDELYKRVDDRIENMFEQGLVAEVKNLLNRGYSSELPSLSAIGYREVICYLNGQYSIEEAKVLMRRKTREYIRRQANWFKVDNPDIEWYNMAPDPLDLITQSVRNWRKDKN